MKNPSWNSRKIYPIHWVVICAILAGFLCVLICSQARISWTVDEMRWVTTGRHIVESGWTDCADEVSHPILFMLTQAMVSDWFSDGSHESDLTWARLSLYPYHLLCLLVLFFWAKRLNGIDAGIVAMGFLAFSPTYLAHARLATSDAMLTSAVLVTAAIFIRHLDKPTFLRGCLLTAALTFGMLSKFSFLFIPVILFVPTLLKNGTMADRIKNVLKIWMVPLFSSLLLVNQAYGFHGTGRTLSSYCLRSPVLNTLAKSVLGQIPLPLPQRYILGMDLHLKFLGRWRSFLFGHISTNGFAGYDIIAFLLKTTMPALILIGVSIALCRRKKLHSDEKTALFIAISWLLYFAFLHRVDCGVRYILPIYPLLFLVGSRVASCGREKRFKGRHFALGLLVFHVTITLICFPYYISFFNMAIGGPSHGYRYLGDSNLTWVQELKELGTYQETHHIEEYIFGLEHFHEMFEPYIRYRPITHREKYFPTSGDYAIWVASLQMLQHANPNEFLWFRLIEPETVIANANYVYRIDVAPGDELNFLRNAVKANRKNGFAFPWAEKWLEDVNYTLRYPLNNLPVDGLRGDFRLELTDVPATNTVSVAPYEAGLNLELSLIDTDGNSIPGCLVNSCSDGDVQFYWAEEVKATSIVGKQRSVESPIQEIVFLYALD